MVDSIAREYPTSDSDLAIDESILFADDQNRSGRIHRGGRQAHHAFKRRLLDSNRDEITRPETRRAVQAREQQAPGLAFADGGAFTADDAPRLEIDAQDGARSLVGEERYQLEQLLQDLARRGVMNEQPADGGAEDEADAEARAHETEIGGALFLDA